MTQNSPDKKAMKITQIVRTLIVMWPIVVLSTSMSLFGRQKEISLRIESSCEGEPIVINNVDTFPCTEKWYLTKMQVPTHREINISHGKSFLCIPKFFVSNIVEIRVQSVNNSSQLQDEDNFSVVVTMTNADQFVQIVKKRTSFHLLMESRPPCIRPDSVRVILEGDAFEKGLKIKYRGNSISQDDWEYDGSTGVLGLFDIKIPRKIEWIYLYDNLNTYKIRVPILHAFDYLEIFVTEGKEALSIRMDYSLYPPILY